MISTIPTQRVWLVIEKFPIDGDYKIDLTPVFSTEQLANKYCDSRLFIGMKETENWLRINKAKNTLAVVKEKWLWLGDWGSLVESREFINQFVQWWNQWDGKSVIRFAFLERIFYDIHVQDGWNIKIKEKQIINSLRHP